MNNISELLRAHLSSINIPEPNAKVFKDECVYSFDTPFTDTGLYVCLQTFYGLGKEHLERHHRKTGSCVYVHMKYEKILVEQQDSEVAEEKKVTRLAIGVEGGFDANPLAKKFETRKNYSVVILPQLIIVPWPNDALPEKVVDSVNGIINAESVHKLIEMESGVWDGEIRQVSKHAHDLLQFGNKRVPPSGWKCEQCDKTDNLWLNLTDGSILCGRKYYDGKGGNGHALEHFLECRYPLAVKLGTITKEGKADVFSYDEDNMVEDPDLNKHLAHFGISIDNMVKTEKSMLELELELNQKLGEWAALQEAGSNLQPLYGPGYTGLVNLGNLCYMNCTMQVVFTVPSFISKFVDNSAVLFDHVSGNPANDFNCQMAKLGVGLLSGKYSRPPTSEIDNSFSVTPAMFKTVVGRNSAQFSTKNQQDAQEFFLYLLTTVQKASRHAVDPTETFKFRIEERYQCHASGKVQYQYRNDYCLPIMIPMEAALNKEEVAAYEARLAENSANGNHGQAQEVVRPFIKFSSCLEAFIQSELVDQFHSTAIKEKTTASKTTRLSEFPEYLFIHLKKYTLRDDWTPMKLDVCVDMPDTLDLSTLRGYGLQPHEELLPAYDDTQEVVTFNDEFLNQLMDMGFPMDGCRRALYYTKNESVESAATWLMEHLDDPTITEPFVPPTRANARDMSNKPVNEVALITLMDLGFSRTHATKALRATDNMVERAADWVFNHPDEGDLVPMVTDIVPPPSDASSSKASYVYRMKAFISHMGPSTAVGHYVCHILREGKWVIYNDEKVALSENPPKGLGYVYLYERM